MHKPLHEHKPHPRATRSDKIRFYTLLVLLACSLGLAWLINSGLSLTLGQQFGS